ncbi:MAG: sensor histidine kinase, partial [Candidatus Heimdallarchaeota archaeon]
MVLINQFDLAINIALASFALVASIVFWFTWRKRPDLIYWFIALLVFTTGHFLLVFKQHNVLFIYLGNGVQLLALFIVVISTFFEYINLKIKSQEDEKVIKEEKSVVITTILLTFLIGAIAITLLSIYTGFDILNTIVILMISFLIPTSIFVMRIYNIQKTITRLFMFYAFISAIFTAVTTILYKYFQWGIALNIAFNFIFMTFILTGGIVAPIEKRIANSEEKYRSLSEHLEEKVEERTQQLALANKELESFSYSVSHDLRTPLRSIAGFAKILKDEYNIKLDKEGTDYVKRILNNTERMNELINDMLDLAQISRADFIIETVDLSKIANDVMSNLKLSLPKREIEFTVEEKIEAQGDSKLLKIVLENLLSNAIKFSKTKSKTIIRFGSTEKRDQNVFFIEDNGIGFDMQYYEKLFGLFQRLHSSSKYEGTGIGLITVKRIIERHKGEIWAESEPDKGTTFYFTLKEKIEKIPSHYFL